MRKAGGVFVGLALSVSVISASPAEAYPIFVSCNADGTLKDSIDARSIQSAVLGATDTPAMERKIREYCAGRDDCFAILKQALMLTQSSVEAANALFQEEVRKLEELAHELNREIDPALASTARQLVELSNEIHACRLRQENQDWQPFLHGEQLSQQSGEGLSVFMQHRVDNEYLFVSGVGKTDAQNRKTDFETIRRIVEYATVAGIDPYMALAISYLENGKPKEFILDPVAAVEMMGCPKKRLGVVDDHDAAAVKRREDALRAQGQTFFYSFGTFYAVENGVRENAALYRMMKDGAGSLDPQAAAGGSPALACFQNSGPFIAKTNGEVLWSQVDGTARVADACCVKIPYPSYTAFYAMANLFVKQRLVMSGKPENVLQSFNGKTKLMGITEKAGVGAFRLGISTIDDPHYGYQGMDFILNSFMNNPLLRAVVDQAEARHGKKAKSLLCSGRGAGTFVIDSDYYLEKSKRAKRFQVLVGKGWGELTPMQKSLMRHEWKLMEEAASQRNAKHSDAEHADYRSKLSAFSALSGDEQKWAYYRKNLYPYRDTLGKTSLKSWRRLDEADQRGIREKVLAAPAQ